MPQPVIFCVEGSHQRGMGHVYRSLRVASVLRKDGLPCLFVCNDHKGALHVLREAGFPLLLAPVGKVDGQWETAVLREHKPRVWWNDRMETGLAHVHALAAAQPAMPRVHVDDAGEGGQKADLRLLTMPCFFDLPAPAGVRQYVGAAYMLLDTSLAGRGRTRAAAMPLRVLVSMGGSDTYGATVSVLSQLLQLPAGQLALTCATGPGFEHAPALAPVLAQRPQWTHKICVPSLFDEFDAHDLLFCGGGMTPFEAAITGLPCCIVATEEHEAINARYLQDNGCAVWAGQRQYNGVPGAASTHALFSGDMLKALEEATHNLATLSANGPKVCDGRGVLRCAALLKELCNE